MKCSAVFHEDYKTITKNTFLPETGDHSPLLPLNTFMLVRDTVSLLFSIYYVRTFMSTSQEKCDNET